MRHQLTKRFVVVLAAVLVIAVVVWSGLAQTVDASDHQDGTETALSLTGDFGATEAPRAAVEVTTIGTPAGVLRRSRSTRVG